MELIIVMTIISTLSVMVLPVFNSAFRRVTRDNGFDDFVATLKHAQACAITSSLEHRVYIDLKKNAYWLERFDKIDAGKKVFKPVLDRIAERRPLPSGLTFEKDRLKALKDDTGRYYLSFYPSGARDAGRVSMRIAGRQFTRYEVSMEGRIAGFEIKRPRDER